MCFLSLSRTSPVYCTLYMRWWTHQWITPPAAVRPSGWNSPSPQTPARDGGTSPRPTQVHRECVFHDKRCFSEQYQGDPKMKLSSFTHPQCFYKPVWHGAQKKRFSRMLILSIGLYSESSEAVQEVYVRDRLRCIGAVCNLPWYFSFSFLSLSLTHFLWTSAA